MIKFDTLKVGLNATKEVEVNNNMKLPATTGTVSEPFSAIFKELRGNYPADSTIYFGENGRIRDANGTPYTTNQGYGVLGVTDSTGKLTIRSFATVIINTPIELTAGTEGNITGTSNGSYVDVQYRSVDPAGEWTTFELGVEVVDGDWTATGTIPDAGTYDIRAVDTIDPDGYAQVDDVEVASSVVKYLYIADTSNNRIVKLLASDLSYVGGISVTQPLGITGDDIYIYVSFAYSNTIKKYRKDTLAFVDSKNGAPTYVYGLDCDDTHLYNIGWPVTGVIQKMLKSDLSNITTISSSDIKGEAICVDNDYVWTLNTNASSGKIIEKRSKSTLAIVDSGVSYGTNYDQLKTPKGIAQRGDYLFVADTANGVIKKFKKSDFSFVSQKHSAETANTRDIDIDDNNIYSITSTTVYRWSLAYSVEDSKTTANSISFNNLTGIHLSEE